MSTIKTNAIQTTGNKSILTSSGHILKVVHDRDDTTYGSTSTTYSQITNLVASITPSSTSSTILVMVSLMFTPHDDSGIHFSIRRSGNSLINADTASYYHGDVTNPDYRMVSSNINIVDSPASISNLDYTVFMRSDTGAQVYLNRPSNTTYTSRSGVFGSSSITLMEIVG